MINLKGKAVSPGIAIGKLFLLDEDQIQIQGKTLSDEDVEKEIINFFNAIKNTEEDILKIKENVEKNLGTSYGEIFDTHLMFLKDKLLLDNTISEMRKTRKSSDEVFYRIMKKTQESLISTNDEYLKERASDIRDIKRRVIRKIQGDDRLCVHQINEEAIVVSHELTPSLTVNLDKSKVLGFVTELGGRTSHAAILARAIEVPSVVGVKNLIKNIEPGDTVIIDGNSGDIIINPNEEVLKNYKKLKEGLYKISKSLEKIISLPAITLDGKEIDLSANIELPQEIDSVIAYGSHGIGLYRTEYLYLLKNHSPTEEEQHQEYENIAKRVYPKPVIIRTIDLGGDKLVKTPKGLQEDNPFLGWRAIRVCFDYPELFKTQLRAILKASKIGNVAIMFPMISGLGELIKAKSFLEESKEELIKEKIPFDENIKIGIMIELPSAVMIAEELSKEVDFFSIGTNDLIQYTLAVDRGNVRVSNLFQFFHPAVLKLIKITVDAGHKNGIWVGMCGEMAGDPIAAYLLVGLGLDEFSVSPLILSEIKQIIRSIRFSDAKKISKKCLNMNSSEEIEEYLIKLTKEKFPNLPL
jgi:phosphotransferase system enzyme I (PtsI)